MCAQGIRGAEPFVRICKSMGTDLRRRVAGTADQPQASRFPNLRRAGLLGAVLRRATLSFQTFSSNLTPPLVHGGIMSAMVGNQNPNDHSRPV